MKYAVETGSCTVIYFCTKFIKYKFRLSKVNRGRDSQTDTQTLKYTDTGGIEIP
jgi:hypothetical protein